MTPTQQEYYPSWQSYSSIFHLGHRAVQDLTKVPLYVQEKVDGSQFSFGMFGGELRVRSKGAILYPEAPEKMFAKAVEEIKSIQSLLTDGWTYRGEYLVKPRHNVLAYERVPAHNIILFDITVGDNVFLEYEQVAAEAQRIGLEVVPLLHQGIITLDIIRELLSTSSILGGQKIEGVVLKPVGYSLFGVDKKVLMGKFVSEEFKEVHAGVWKKDNPGRGDVVQLIIDSLRTPARWNKGVMHLREAGLLEDSPRDIGNLIKAVQVDLAKEEKEQVGEQLLKYFWPTIVRGATAGVAEYYKEQLMKKQFNELDPENHEIYHHVASDDGMPEAPEPMGASN